MKNGLPIACTLTPGERQRREGELLPGLIALVESHESLPNGTRLRFSASSEVLEAIMRVIDVERRCCQFLRFQVTVEQALGPIVLDLEGPKGTAEFIDGLIEEARLAQPQSSK